MALNTPPSVVVLGMHRSGTSLLTGSLEAAGLYLGNVVNAAPHNLKGNKENEAIRDLNDALFAKQGTAWNAPPNRQLPWDRNARAQARALIQPYLDGGQPWGFKDPRTVWTVEGWMEVLPTPRLIGVFRHPSLVTRSLVARGGALSVTEAEAIELWCAYNRELINLRRRYGFPLLHFESRPRPKRGRSTTGLPKWRRIENRDRRTMRPRIQRLHGRRVGVVRARGGASAAPSRPTVVRVAAGSDPHGACGLRGGGHERLLGAVWRLIG